MDENRMDMTDKPCILFVCGRNQWRSPTAARIYAHDPRIRVRARGVSSKSRRQIRAGDVEWADLILVMENRYKSRIAATYRKLCLPPVESLDIPDDFEFMDTELISRIKSGTEVHLSRRFGL